MPQASLVTQSALMTRSALMIGMIGTTGQKLLWPYKSLGCFYPQSFHDRNEARMPPCNFHCGLEGTLNRAWIQVYCPPEGGTPNSSPSQSDQANKIRQQYY